MKSYPTKKPILIIDDEISILKVSERILSRNGYGVDMAANGEEGIRKIENNEYSLILTDIEMSGISGDQVLDYLRNKIKKSTPVVGMSGTPWFLDQSNFDAVLPKPYSMKELLDCISQFAEK
ncbi:MAG: response regulator [Proteobacteria bacterium]|nr:response regulator [Pseudomonadota bacterium]